MGRNGKLGFHDTFEMFPKKKVIEIVVGLGLFFFFWLQ